MHLLTCPQDLFFPNHTKMQPDAFELNTKLPLVKKAKGGKDEREKDLFTQLAIFPISCCLASATLLSDGTLAFTPPTSFSLSSQESNVLQQEKILDDNFSTKQRAK